MTGFAGFSDGKEVCIAVPAEFISSILPSITDLTELKVILYGFRSLNSQSGMVKFFFLDDFLADPKMLEDIQDNHHRVELVTEALAKACEHGVFIPANYEERQIFFLNTPHSRAALRAMNQRAWSPDDQQISFAVNASDNANIFEMYEQNIGPLTPILAETLATAEKEYPAGWIEEATRIAVKKNVRNWSYIEAILRSWKEKGRSEKNKRNDEENPRRYIEGDLADYIKH